MENNDEFWKEIKKQFLEIETLIRDFRLPEKVDIELYQLHYLINGYWPKWGKTIYSFCHFPQSEAEILSIIGSASALGLRVPKGYQPEFLNRNKSLKSLNQIISSAIASRQVSNEFITAWGEYNFHSANIISAIADNNSQNYETTYIKKNLPNLIERYIFAFWVHANWINGSQTKDDARDGLADRIEEILELKNSYPEWKVRALKNMLAKDHSGIKKTYTEINEDNIRDMVRTASRLKEAIEIK